MSDLTAVRMVGIAVFERGNRPDFERWFERLRTTTGVLSRTAEVDGRAVGVVAAFDADGEREVTYWIDPRRWRQGCASAALEQLLAVESARPLHARTLTSNTGSCRLLERSGFRAVAEETLFAEPLGREERVSVSRLDR